MSEDRQRVEEKMCVAFKYASHLSSEGFSPWHIASSVLQNSRWHGAVGTWFGFALGMRLKRMLDNNRILSLSSPG